MAHHNVDLKKLWRRTGLFILGLLVIGVGLAILVDQGKRHNLLPPETIDPIKALIVLMIGGAISYLLERYLFQLAARALGANRTTSLRFLIRLFLLLAVILSVLAAFGVGLSSVVFGGAFVTAIIGLAGQTMFGNLIAGIAILVFHPFEVGDRINFVAWQYPVLMPSFPHEALKPTYSGVVTDITLMYTSLATDTGPTMVIPNGIIIQAAVENMAHAKKRILRMRFDVDMAIDPAELLPRVEKLLNTLGFVGSTPRIIDVTPTTFALLLVVDTKLRSDDEVRHQIFGHLVPMIRHLAHPDSTESGKS
ncbi:mechanosensitive ion channel family protein [Sulfobacillus sp. hq2]|uniref:mechanosensitive ion channel family protein n=1 Tax=Sulfobacillus TaxID=28033 RepID=UPI000CD1CAD8|nr:mechanosensitive ion channel family protein [Sulfobacillus sp. hq2]POB09307.1 mechanosensitive ion channel protein MscS [Sulfobacillus sp. hq2]